MSEKTGAILHRAEERGQGREQQMTEVWVIIVKCIFKAAGISALWGTVITGVRLLAGDTVSVLSTVLTYGVIWVVYFGLRIPDDIEAHDEQLYSERWAESYAPPQPESPQLESPWRPPVPAHHADGTTMIDLNERPALPDGRQTGLNLNEPTVAAILREIVTKHDGLWSRDRLMAIKVGGERVTRAIYEALTPQLCKVGFLQERPRGGFKLADDIELETYFPSLQLSRRAGGRPGGPERDRSDGDRPPDRGVVRNLAERRKNRFLECGCDVDSYLERKGHRDQDS